MYLPAGTIPPEIVKRNRLLMDLSKLHGSKDPEAAHREADDLIIGYLQDKEIAEAYRLVPKWYV